jgi:alkaline phosphatase
MKTRNLIVAALCILVFVAIGVVAFRFGMNRKPFGVVLFLVDGFDANLVAAARLYEGGADHRLSLESMPGLALARNASADFAVPDEAAAASAIATGKAVNNRALSVDPAGNRLQTLLELAKQRGRATGIVTDGELAAPGIAAFYAHAPSDARPTDLAAELIERSGVDLALGGGAAPFISVSKRGIREDGRDLLIEARERGAEVLRQKNELETIASARKGPIFGIFSLGHLAHRDEIPERAIQPSLPDLVRHAIQTLQSDSGGYFLVVSAALPAKAAYDKQGERMITGFLEFDQALGVARRYAGENAVIMAAGRAAIGGLTLNGYPLRHDWGVALVGTNPLGYQSISWSGSADATGGNADQPAPHHAADLMVVGTGQGAADLRGILDDTALFDILARQL